MLVGRREGAALERKLRRRAEPFSELVSFATKQNCVPKSLYLEISATERVVSVLFCVFVEFEVETLLLSLVADLSASLHRPPDHQHPSPSFFRLLDPRLMFEPFAKGTGEDARPTWKGQYPSIQSPNDGRKRKGGRSLEEGERG